MKTLCLAACLLASTAHVSLAQSSAERPALVVLIAVDQLRGDYLD